MKNKLIGIPIFLYLLLSVNITTCAPQVSEQKKHKEHVTRIVENAVKNALKPVTNSSGDDVFLVDLLCLMPMKEIQSIHAGDATLQKKLQDSYTTKHVEYLKNPEASNIATSNSCPDFQDRKKLIKTAKVAIPQPVKPTKEGMFELSKTVYQELTPSDQKALRSADNTAIKDFVNKVIIKSVRRNKEKVSS